MTACELHDAPDIELYFYDELGDADRARVAAHLASCAECRARLEELDAIRRALNAAAVIDAPPAGDWSRFMHRLDAAVGLPVQERRGVVLEMAGRAWNARHLVALAATLVLVALGVYMAARVPSVQTSPAVAENVAGAKPQGGLNPAAALREVSAEHLERSKLVVLGLAARDPHTTGAGDWQYERKLAGNLLPETRLYRLAAQERGVDDLAHVMRDLETVLLEASMSDGTDRDSLERVQHLIARRGLVSKMQIIAATSAGL